MGFFNSYRKNLYRFFTNEDKAEGLEMQPFLSKKILRLMNKFGGRKNAIQPVEFFFYTDEEDKANNLAIELTKRGYEIYGVHAPESEDRQWSITGCTQSIQLDDNTIEEWSKQMVQSGYECDCRFDGWGTLIQ